MPQWPRVALMILNFNGLTWLRICLPSVVKSTYQNLDLYVIDNGSTDASCEFVNSNYPHIKLIRFDQNLGFTEAYNRAIRKAEAEYILLLNNDTAVLDANWTDVLVDRAERDPSVAAVGCKLIMMNNHRKIDSIGGIGIRYWRGFVDIGKHEIDRGQYDHPEVTPFSVCGAAMLVRRTAFMEIGGFDPKFFMYDEDVDLCWRFRLLGYKIAYEPSVRVAHYLSGTSGQRLDAPKVYLSHRNLLRLILKNCGPTLRWALATYLLFTFIVAVGFCIFEPMKAVAIVRAVLWNLFNLKDTYAMRASIQGGRTKSEKEVLAAMYPNLPRYEPAEHTQLRHILNVLFEYSQSPSRLFDRRN